MEHVRNAFAAVAFPVMWLIDWITTDDEYDRIIAEQHARNIARSFDND